MTQWLNCCVGLNLRRRQNSGVYGKIGARRENDKLREGEDGKRVVVWSIVSRDVNKEHVFTHLEVLVYADA